MVKRAGRSEEAHAVTPRDMSGASRLDVVAQLAAHQQNLSVPPAPARAALLALPLAPVSSFIAADWFASARARALSELAETLGGGDGPSPLVDLAAAGSLPLPARLAQLWRSGTRALLVHGMDDQPGHARALRYRWPGALHAVGRPGALDALQRGDEPVRWLAPGVARTAPGVPAPGGARCVLAAVDEGGDPTVVRAQGAHVWPFALDPDRRLGPWSGALPPRGALGGAEGARIRARWDEFWTELGHPDVVRLAVLGLDPALEEALREEAREPRSTDESARRARVVAITGIDGSGKSSHAGRLARRLGEHGADVRVLKLYRQGAFLELADELGARTRRGGPLAGFRTSRVVKLVDSLRVYRDEIAPALAEADVLVMDRYVETHVAAAASQLGWDLSRHAALAPFPPAELRFWLELDPELALARRDARGGRRSADEHAVGLAGYAREFAHLAAGPGEVRLDATAPEETNARAIDERVLPLLADRRGPAGGNRPQPASSAPPVARAVTAPPCLLHLTPLPRSAGRSRDPREGLPELGADLLALRGALASWCGSAAAAAVPEAFWLEAYATQLVLDLRTLAPARARVALWPGALARMPGNADLAMLGEVERMLLPHVEVVVCAAPHGAHAASFAALGAHPTAAMRLAADYAAALDRLARDAGWPISPGT